MHKPRLIATQLDEIAAEMQAIQDKKLKLIKETIKSCSHPIECVRELPYQEGTWLASTPPWLICTDCGYTEEGWGCGYLKLRHADTDKQPVISFDEWLNIRTVTMSQIELSKLRFGPEKS